MTEEDKYGILAQLDEVLKNPDTQDWLARRQDLIVNAIWEEVYVKMPLCDPNDSSLRRVVEILRDRCGDNLKVEESCGIFSVTKLTLPHNVCYLQRCQESYHILPMYKSVRRFYTRLEPEVAADLILEFDRCAPIILKRIEDRIAEQKRDMLVREMVKTTAVSIIEKLKSDGRITVPDEVKVSANSITLVHVRFKSHKVIHCRLDNLENQLLKKFGSPNNNLSKG